MVADIDEGDWGDICVGSTACALKSMLAGEGSVEVAAKGRRQRRCERGML